MKNYTNPTALANLTKKDGYISIFVALIILNIVTLIILGTLDALKNYTEQTTNSEHNEKAMQAVRTGLNIGKNLASNLAPGINVPLHYFCNDGDGSPGTVGLGVPPSTAPCDKFVSTYEVKSLAVDIDPAPGSGHQRYIVPPPGEGDAGENCERLDNYDDPQQRQNIIGVEENVKKPCNWNKLAYGESIEIPLYTTYNGATINPPDLPDGLTLPAGLDAFTLKVRTPCTDPMYDDSNGYLKGWANDGDAEEDEWCTNGSLNGADARPELYDTTPGPGDPTDIIVHWQILGDCTYFDVAGNEVTEHGGQCIGLAVTPNVTLTDPDDNSDINIAVINDGKDSVNVPYAVLGNGTIPFTRVEVEDLKTTNISGHISISPILDYLTAEGNASVQFPNTTSRTLNEPRLKLSVVSPMYTDPLGETQVSYIEYQLEVDQPIADSFWTVYATGRYGNHKVIKKGKVGSPTSIIDFVFQN